MIKWPETFSIADLRKARRNSKQIHVNPVAWSENSENAYEEVTLCVGFTSSLLCKVSNPPLPPPPLTEQYGAYACQSLRD